MKMIFALILFLLFFNNSISVVPTWNFDSSSKNLLENGNLEYEVKSGNFWGTNRVGNYTLYKKLYKENGLIKQINTIKIDNNINFTVDYDDVESAYRNDQYVFICPKGKFYIQRYELNNKIVDNLTNVDLGQTEYWDLKCYYMYYEEILFIGYLNSQNNFYSYDLKNNNFKDNHNIFNGIYSFYSHIGSKNNPIKKMFAIVNDGDILQLKEINIQIYQGQAYNWWQEGNGKNLVQKKSKTFSSSPILNTYFYFINYNTKSDFESGYLFQNITSVNDSINFIIYSNKTPFEFLDDINITETKFIYETKFVYYKAYNNNKKILYNGVYDTILNKIIFNTDKEILEFKPFSFMSNINAMLAITKDSAYKICLFDKDSNGDCLNECSGNAILDAESYNHCGSECQTNYILKPNNICINSCNESIYIIKDKECSLCKDIDNGNKKFKLINWNDCLQNMPENSFYVNKELYLIECNKGTKYNSETDKCIPDDCHENCDGCTENSKDNKNQKCIACKSQFLFLEKGNCVEKCSKGYFAKDKNCEECDNICDSCEFKSDNCTNCIKGKYLEKKEDIQTCKNCSIKCETCSKGDEDGYDNCETCNIKSDFKYLFNRSCVEICPDNMTEKNYKCYDKKDIKVNNNDKIFRLIFIIVCSMKKKY